MTLSACLAGGSGGGSGGGGSGGGGSGSGLSPAAFETEFNRFSQMSPTGDMPLNGSAQFEGAAMTTLTYGNTPIGEIMGDIEMTVDFAAAATPATQNGALSGKISNVRGTIAGNEHRFTGELTTARAKDSSLGSVVRTTESTVTPSVGGPQTMRTGSLLAHFAGDMQVGDDRAPVVIQADGIFQGPGASAAVGTVRGTWMDPNLPEALNVSGGFFVERK